MDLLTVLMHEMGHALGLDHDPANPHDVMSGTLVTGERRLPDAADVTQTEQKSAGATAPALADIHSAMPDMGTNGGSAVGSPAVTQAVADRGTGLPDAFDFSALRTLPNTGAPEAKLEEAFAAAKAGFGALFDASHGEHLLADLAAQLHDGHVEEVLHALLSPSTPQQHPDWLG
jgi:hypothetical protein